MVPTVTVQEWIFFILVDLIVFGVVIIGVFLNRKRWSIPVLVLRFTGSKTRPLMIRTWGKVSKSNGISFLNIKGYDLPIRNYKSENYFPAAKSARGGLILWEFKGRWFTPTVPKTRGMDARTKAEVARCLQVLNEHTAVKFNFDEKLYNELLLTAVDDVDAEWFVRTLARQEGQYTSGWRDFLSKYGGHMLVGVVALFMLVGFIVWMKDAPNQAGQCIQAGVEAAKNTYLTEIAAKAGIPSGVPPG